MNITSTYARYACPCSEEIIAAPSSVLGKRSSRQEDQVSASEELTFNPHDRRAAFSLCPIDQLLFCDECNHTRCPRCWTEEIIYWYCPNCLFEVPSSGVKSDGNRCTRHCYDCPICTATLSITALPRPAETHLKPTDNPGSNDSFILHCQHCEWSSLDIGVSFNKPTKITEQLNRLWKARHASRREGTVDNEQRGEVSASHPHTTFEDLATFYKEQLQDSIDVQNTYGSSPYNSPANLQRIMNLYGGLSYSALKKTREKPQPMREARDWDEGLVTYTSAEQAEDDEVLGQLMDLGLSGTTTSAQRLAAPSNFNARFTSELWPVATPLRTRRGKRCRVCRQFLARPEPKVGSMRYKIRLIAVNFVQRLSIRPLHSPSLPHNGALHLRAEAMAEITLQPHRPQQFVLTVRNPIFETVKVTLATPATTPGKVASRVTILCPSFTVGPAGDMWDEALSSTGSTNNSDGSRQAAMASLTGSNDSDRQPEAGKIWERSRNSTSVVLEIVPGGLTSSHGITPKSDEDSAAAELGEDDDFLEIPIFVRVEWEADGHDGEGLPTGEKKKERESKELAYWCVLGVGRIVES